MWEWMKKRYLISVYFFRLGYSSLADQPRLNPAFNFATSKQLPLLSIIMNSKFLDLKMFGIWADSISMTSGSHLSPRVIEPPRNTPNTARAVLDRHPGAQQQDRTGWR
jgi:hypothetical protein